MIDIQNLTEYSKASSNMRLYFMATTPEGRVKELITRWFKSNSINYWMVIPSAYGKTTGMSDYVGILPSGKWIAIEAKAYGKKKGVTVKQQEFLDTINAHNGFGFVVDREDDLTEIETFLKRQGEL